MQKIPKRILTTLESICEMSEAVGGSIHAACITHKNKIITTGRNQAKTHPKVIRYTKNHLQAFLHAEMDAVFSFVRQYDETLLSSCTLYVIRKDLQLSKPCKACLKMIRFYKLKEIVHS